MKHIVIKLNIEWLFEEEDDFEENDEEQDEEDDEEYEEHWHISL
jgi:hypothetical protein